MEKTQIDAARQRQKLSRPAEHDTVADDFLCGVGGRCAGEGEVVKSVMHFSGVGGIGSIWNKGDRVALEIVLVAAPPQNRYHVIAEPITLEHRGLRFDDLTRGCAATVNLHRLRGCDGEITLRRGARRRSEIRRRETDTAGQLGNGDGLQPHRLTTQHRVADVNNQPGSARKYVDAGIDGAGDWPSGGESVAITNRIGQAVFVEARQGVSSQPAAKPRRCVLEIKAQVRRRPPCFALGKIICPVGLSENDERPAEVRIGLAVGERDGRLDPHVVNLLG